MRLANFFSHNMVYMCAYILCIVPVQPTTHTLKPKLDPASSEYVLDLLSTCEQKLVLQAEELSSQDLETIQKEMEDDEVCTFLCKHILRRCCTSFSAAVLHDVGLVQEKHRRPYIQTRSYLHEQVLYLGRNCCSHILCLFPSIVPKQSRNTHPCRECSHSAA